MDVLCVTGKRRKWKMLEKQKKKGYTHKQEVRTYRQTDHSLTKTRYTQT